MREADTGCVAGKRVPASIEVLNQLEHLTARAEELAERVNSKLAPVMISDHPVPAGTNKEIDREWPQLFGSMRSMLRRIDNALESVEDCLTRTEL